MGPSRRWFFFKDAWQLSNQNQKKQHLKNTFQAHFFLNQALESTKRDICSKGNFIFQRLIFKGDLLVFGSVTCLTMDYTPENKRLETQKMMVWKRWIVLNMAVLGTYSTSWLVGGFNPFEKYKPHFGHHKRTHSGQHHKGPTQSTTFRPT